MKIAILAVTKTGAQLAGKIKDNLDTLGEYSAELYLNSKLEGFEGKFSPITSLSQWMKENFQQFDGIICIMATGIVVRIIAPHLVHKSKDPAVVVLDEKGQYSISLISGHLGGANELADIVAEGLGAQAVITTATDVQGKPAIDLIARKCNLFIKDTNKIKLINTLLLEAAAVDIYTQIPLEIGDIDNVNILPIKELSSDKVKLVFDDVEEGKRGLVVITNESLGRYDYLPAKTMIMGPKNIIIGIGCRRGVNLETIEEAVTRGLNEIGLNKKSILNLASIDIKQDETGLLQLADKWQVPIKFFTRDEIAGVIQSNLIENVSISEFVYEKIGVGGVCEPVIMLSNQNAKIVLPKTKWQGVTVAIGLVPSM